MAAEQEQNHLHIATSLKQTLNSCLELMIHTDEAWIRDYEPGLKAQSDESEGPASQRQTSFKGQANDDITTFHANP